MKKLVLGLVLTFSLLALGNAYAQEWTWSDPSPVTSPFLKEIAADPVTGEIYGIDNTGLLVMPVLTGAAVTGLSQVPGGSDSVVNDIAVAPTGAIFICTESFIKQQDGGIFVAVVQQPRPPEDSVTPDPEDILQGKYTHVAVGQGGRLYVIYQIDSTETQYLMVGTPPVTSEGVLVEIHPETLNLGSKGKWVTSIINLPEGSDENDIVLETVKISRISIPSLSIDEAVDIPIAEGAPWSVELVDGIQVLKVKFPRYDKADPTDPQSLIGKLRELLAAANAAPGRYEVTLTVDMQLTSLEQFSGTDTIRIKLKHKMH
jgi:hypothetical protein